MSDLTGLIVLVTIAALVLAVLLGAGYLAWLEDEPAQDESPRVALHRAPAPCSNGCGRPAGMCTWELDHGGVSVRLCRVCCPHCSPGANPRVMLEMCMPPHWRTSAEERGL